MSLQQIIDGPPVNVSSTDVDDTPYRAWTHNFPSADLVSAAAGLFVGTRIAERRLGITLLGIAAPDLSVPSVAKGVELHGDPYAGKATDRVMVEGPRWRVVVSPGSVAVRSVDPVRAERAVERLRRASEALQDQTARDLLAGVERDEHVSNGGALVTSWSPRSRSRMSEACASLDYSPMFATDEKPAMVTLTYPGDWLAVAPNARECRRHFLALRKRYERAWDRKIRGIWKREFQRRGAPHWHLFMTPPHGRTAEGLNFRDWLSQEWAHIVGADWCGTPCWKTGACCERGRHKLAGTGIDYAEGVKASDPRSVGVYFAKHGAYAAKEYQNHAPDEWPAGESVGRFWGVWGLDKATAGVEVAPNEALAAARTMRRWSRANAHVTRVPAWKYRTVVDPDTGEIRARWRKGTRSQRVYRMRYGAGFLAVKDGPAFAGSLARHLDGLYRPGSVVSRSGSGPVGFLP